jgi:hypothetical protein
MKKCLFKISMVFFTMFCLNACVPLKPYERVYVNDPEMQMGTDAGNNFNSYVQSIREGAIPAGTAKASGGCGCN